MSSLGIKRSDLDKENIPLQNLQISKDPSSFAKPPLGGSSQDKAGLIVATEGAETAP